MSTQRQSAPAGLQAHSPFAQIPLDPGKFGASKRQVAPVGQLSTHDPAWQISPARQLALQSNVPPQPSSIAVPQTPAGQVLVGVQVQMPLRQEPVANPSSQGVPSAFAGLVHVPVVGSQMPPSWHWSRAVQIVATTLPQTPAWHVGARHKLAGVGQSAPLRHWQRDRPVRSRGPQSPVAHSPFLRQTSPADRSVAARVRSPRATAANAPSAVPRSVRRDEAWAAARVKASNREPSTATFHHSSRQGRSPQHTLSPTDHHGVLRAGVA